MNKKLIAAALAVLPTAAAMADVTLYGNIEADIENGKSNTYSFAPKADGKLNSGTRIDDTGSLIGFKGTEDLGNGLKAIWQVEQGLNIDGTTGPASGNSYDNTFATRDSFVGLEGGFGKVRLGKLSTYLNSDMEKADAWLYGKGVNGLTYSSMNQLDTRVNNAIRYDSPELYGFKGTVVYGTDEARDYAGNGSRKNAQTWNVGLGYQNAGYFADFGYVRNQDAFEYADGTPKAANYWRLEGGYNANNLLVAAYYGQQKGEYDNAGVRLKSKEAGVTVGYTIGAFTPKFSYGRVWGMKTVEGNNDINGHLNQYVVGVDYALSKRTTAYASYGYVSNSFRDAVTDTKLENEHTVAVGVQHKF